MKTITTPELALVAGTRAALGAGIALLLGSRLDAPRRRAVGWTLVAVGAISTIPLMAEILQRKPWEDPAPADRTRPFPE
jgi:hypothetical protein